MTRPKLHHYVPRFYLERFTDNLGYLWVWDREKDRVFRSSPNNVAAESHFYRLDQYAHYAVDADVELERQLSVIEADISIITTQWLDWLRNGQKLDRLTIPEENRRGFSLFVALQILRTADHRSLVEAFLEERNDIDSAMNAEQRATEIRRFHTEILWNAEAVDNLSEKIYQSIWLFAKNPTDTQFVTSDNPVTFRTADNKMWVKLGFFRDGTYAAFPIAPDIIIYMYPRHEMWKSLEKFDCQISPVVLTSEMVISENTACVYGFEIYFFK
ncbi:DUF4238 domain-containing protein [Roseococcus sp. SYP-B2431]|uniref:DUF4238 domain-containing protein n=1 Tax=Roseococcus sp. SYP-B2431 TaxID=2496640 RepID=UPI0013F3CFD9|nr:DUF4238 domain-containing protein [Roseococcus sp. SYP-B2431]